MKLMWKFNIVLLAVFAVGFAVTAFISYGVLQANAREEILDNARVMMESALSSRSYTNSQIKPLLETQLKYSFLPQSVPAYAATEQFNDLRKKYPDYNYKEATLNPTNPRDRATDWETDVVNQFRNGQVKGELIGERDTATGRSLYLARPIQITNAACLACHNTVNEAPKTMIELYGPANGFGWKLNEIIGARVGPERAPDPAREPHVQSLHAPADAGARRHLHPDQPDAAHDRGPAGQVPGQARRRGEPRTARERRVQVQEQGRDRRSDPGAGADEQEPGAGHQDAGSLTLSR